MYSVPLPRAASCASARRWPAFPIATTHTTAAMPIAMLNTFSAVRPLVIGERPNASSTRTPVPTYERLVVERRGFPAGAYSRASLLPQASFGILRRSCYPLSPPGRGRPCTAEHRLLAGVAREHQPIFLARRDFVARERSKSLDGGMNSACRRDDVSRIDGGRRPPLERVFRTDPLRRGASGRGALGGDRSKEPGRPPARRAALAHRRAARDRLRGGS